CDAPFQTIPLTAEQVRVRHMEGLMHDFRALRTLDGRRLADSETTQIAEGDRVTSRLIFRFKDGSVYDDTTIFSQQGAFRVLSDHLVQRGPSFKQPMETSIDASSGQVTVRYKDQDGGEKILRERRDLPPDIANGLLFTLVKHIQPNVPQTTVSLVATTPKPRVVKLESPSRRRESDSKWQHQTQNGTLRREGKNRRCSWIDGTALGETASRHARVGSYWRYPGFRQIGRSALRRWPPLAD